MKTFFTWAAAIALIVGAAVAASGFFPSSKGSVLAWVILLVGIFIGFVRLGRKVTGVGNGIFINSRYRISLSRFQIVLWTILVLSTYGTAVVINCALREPDPLAVGIPEELWVLMGIVTVPLIGSPLLMDRRKKAESEPDPSDDAGRPGPRPSATETARKAAREEAQETSAENLYATNSRVSEATWSDLIRSELTEKDADRLVDITRTQALFFTIVLLLGYAYAFGQGLVTGGGGRISELPAITPGMLALIGISQTAYLGGKAVPTQE